MIQVTNALPIALQTWLIWKRLILLVALVLALSFANTALIGLVGLVGLAVAGVVVGVSSI